MYGMITPDSPEGLTGKLTVRSVFIIDPAKKIRLIITYPAATGRNMEEIKRVLEALQLTDSHKVATPVNWTKGESVVVLPNIKDDEAKSLFGSFTTVKPYLRYTDVD